MDMMLLDPFVRLLDDVSPPAAVRAVEAGGSIDAMWSAFVQSGFLDALIPEEKGGAGLDFTDIAPLLFALGAHAVPLPVAETMVGRALLSRAMSDIPDGPLILADLTAGHSDLIPSAAITRHVLADNGNALALFEIGALNVEAMKIHGSLAARISAAGTAVALAETERPKAGLRSIAAIIHAAQMAGAAGHILEMTVSYASTRVQFGKPIGKQQAIQQNLAIMAEKSVMAIMAARIGCAAGLDPNIEGAAVAKQVTSAVASEIANLAHAIHGAIGISEEYDLQLFTRRLHEWRMAAGSEGFWAGILGAKRLERAQSRSVDYVRSIVDA